MGHRHLCQIVCVIPVSLYLCVVPLRFARGISEDLLPSDAEGRSQPSVDPGAGTCGRYVVVLDETQLNKAKPGMWVANLFEWRAQRKI